MTLAQKVTTLGRAARESVALKVRQPVQRVVVRARSEEENAGLQRLSSLLLSELNVKELGFAGEAGDLVDVTVFPLPRQLGQKYGPGYPVIRSKFAGDGPTWTGGQPGSQQIGDSRRRRAGLRR